MTWTVNCSAPTGKAARHRPPSEKFHVTDRHLQEFCGESPFPYELGAAVAVGEPHHPQYRLKEPLSIKPMDFCNYLLDGIARYIRNLRHPSTIPGNSIWSKIYALSLLPALIAVLIFCQSAITMVIVWSSYTNLGRRAFQLFLKNEILMFDTSDTIDPNGTDEALKQISDTQPKSKPAFSYYIASLLLVLSTVAYERDDNLVKSAFHIMGDIQNEGEKAKAAALLEASESTIDVKAQLLGMRFMGVSELKSLGGPYAGLFYNDEAIILVYKGTSVLAFNEYLIDGSITRVDASEYLYGEVHKGFYESIFPDPTPLDGYERATQDRTCPLHAIMETVFEVAKKLKAKTGKPVNLWMTGHSLGGALAALTMARLQLPLRANDPLFKDYDVANISLYNSDGTPRTVLQEMLHRFNNSASSVSSSTPTVVSSSSASTLSSITGTATSIFSHFHHKHGDGSINYGNNHEHQHEHTNFFHRHFDSHSHGKSVDDLIVLRDCYSYASPRVGDTPFAQEFDKHQTSYLEHSPHKPTYYRVIVDKDIVPMLPPSCNSDLDDRREKMFPCAKCAKKSDVPSSTSHNEASEPLQQKPSHPASYGSVDRKSVNAKASDIKHPHMNSLLDYRHVGQMICLPNLRCPPIVKPSEYQTNLCADVLRTDDCALELLQKIEIALNSVPVSLDDPTGFTTTFKRTFSAEKIAKEMDKAKACYDLDVTSRLRVPCTAEKFLLTFPNVISHSPSAYQRNLARTRFYFTSFPGTDLEQLIQDQGPMAISQDGNANRPDSGVVVIQVDSTEYLVR
ncbi:hypothetical protein BGX21_010341 [Mortierella sp. AD011]|nr:hypothetical protein BGX20_009688 [Mortierella sp. AD010]KAF9394546.1 hypothetical protein BGX21_010341 [Mortierella sp. AD011]